MFKNYLRVTIQIILGFSIYYAIRQVTDSTLVVLLVLIAFIILIVVYSIFANKINPTDELEVLCDYEKLHISAERYVEDKDKYNLLMAYGYVHAGLFDKAQEHFSMIEKVKIEQDKNLLFAYTATEIKLVYNKENKDLLEGLINQAIENDVFKNVNVTNDLFRVHLYILNKEYNFAEELAKDVIPVLKKRVYIYELEFLLALAYYEQNKLDDCHAVTEFVIEKNNNLAYTALCKELNDKINRK